MSEFNGDISEFNSDITEIYDDITETHENILNLYKVIEKFKKNKYILQNPDIFKYITEDDFINWIIKK